MKPISEFFGRILTVISRMSYVLFMGLIGTFRLIIVALPILVITFIIMISIGVWYKQQTNNAPRDWGFTWAHEEVTNLGLTNQDLQALLEQIPFQRLQLTSDWNIVEPQRDIYNFTHLDEQFKIAKTSRIRVSLQLGLHQSGLTNCQIPQWVKNLTKEELKEELKDYLSATINHLDTQIHLKQYQLEPDIFKVEQDQCPHILDNRDLTEIYQFVQTLTDKEIALSRPNNQPLILPHNPKAEAFGLSIQPQPVRNKWWHSLTRLTIPSHYYSFTAGNIQIVNSPNNIFIRNLILVPEEIRDTQTLPTSDVIQQAMQYAIDTGIKQINIEDIAWILSQEDSSSREILRAINQIVEADF